MTKRLTNEQIHELAREMAIDLVRAVVDLNTFAIDAICDESNIDDENWACAWQRKMEAAEPHSTALKEFRPYLSHLCSSACAYGFEGDH